MFPVTNLTAAGNQTSAVVLADGTTAKFTFIYRAAVQRWTVDVVYKDFAARAIGLATHPNLLRLWRQVLPFGLQVVTADGTDPFLANDLAYVPNGPPPRVVVNVLDGTAGGTDLTDIEAASFA